MNTRILAAAILIPLLFFWGCASFMPKDLPERSEIDIWNTIHKNTGSITDFQCKGMLTIESGIRKIPVEAELFFRYPDWITIRTYTPIGMKIIEASLQKDQFKVYSIFTNEFFSGNIDSIDLNRRFKMSLPNVDLRNAWRRLFNPDKPYDIPAEVKKLGKYYILSYRQENIIHEIWVDGKKMLVERENVLDEDGILTSYVFYSRYKKRSGVRFPRTIEIGDINGGVRLTIEIDNFKVNSSFSDAKMMISVPADAIRIDL